ncbi:MAG: glycosyltransferase family 2 protein [Anaerolineales bacterium]|nr:glycosyltransferase family 2 protein [Anaerolineales bacterium]
MQTDIKISVIIPFFNNETTIRECLGAVSISTYENMEVILVDDGSTDQSLSRAKEFGYQLIKLDENKGVSFARNCGARAASGEILFFLDADIMVEPDTIEKITSTLQDRPEISALFCSYQKHTPAKTFYSKYKNLLHHYTHQISQEEAATFCGGFGAIKKDVFIDLGGFNESYRYLEDMELGYNLHLRGHRIFLNKKIQLTHLKRYSLFDLMKSDVLHRAKPWTEIMLKKRIIRNDLNTRIENAISLIVAYLMIAAIPIMFVWPLGWILFLVLFSSFLILNRNFLALIYREMGLVFLIISILFNWFSYLYSGVGLFLGMAGYFYHIVFKSKEIIT